MPGPIPSDTPTVIKHNQKHSTVHHLTSILTPLEKMLGTLVSELLGINGIGPTMTIMQQLQDAERGYQLVLHIQLVEHDQVILK